MTTYIAGPMSGIPDFNYPMFHRVAKHLRDRGVDVRNPAENDGGSAPERVRIGSLFSGAGGLDMAVEEVFGGEVVWQCEFNEAASKVLAHRYPHVPNFGDVTAIDWGSVEPVEVMCGGYPCQPFSAAGQRKGTDDERHLWPYFAEAIRRVRPRYVVLENVAGHRSMGFDCVLGDLADIGYDAQWCSVRASDVGAPHRRERVFILAIDANAARHRRHQGRPESARLVRGSDVAVSGDEPAADSSGQRGTDVTRGGDTARQYAVPVTGAGDRDRARGTTSGVRELGAATHELARGMEFLLPGQAREMHGQQWGKYEPAISRWESVTRPAPPPTEPNTRGNPRLAAPFPEWMMGWPAGWVTQVPGISRNDQLRIIGNGVCPQQAIAALRWLLNVCEVAA